MANSNDNEVDTTPDEVIERLGEYSVSHPDQPQSAIVLVGYLGTSPKGPDYVRLYLGLDLETFFEIPKKDIIHRERIERPDAANASKIVVSTAHKLEAVQIHGFEIEAAHLHGSIVAGHLAGTPGEPCSRPPLTCHGFTRLPEILKKLKAKVTTFAHFPYVPGGS